VPLRLAEVTGVSSRSGSLCLKNVRTLSGLPRAEKRLARASLVGSFDRAVSSGSLAFAADAVCYGNSIVLLLFDRFTTAWERYR
jgi:hypothetical protein